MKLLSVAAGQMPRGAGIIYGCRRACAQSCALSSLGETEKVKFNIYEQEFDYEVPIASGAV